MNREKVWSNKSQIHNSTSIKDKLQYLPQRYQGSLKKAKELQTWALAHIKYLN